MKTLALFIILFSQFVAAAPTCGSLFTSGHEYLQRLWEVTEVSGTEPIVEVDNYPIRQPRHRAYRSSSQWWWHSSVLDHHLFKDSDSRSSWEMTNIKADAFYKKVYGQFQDIIADGTITALREVDHTIDLDRSMYGEVRSATQVLGTWRWFRARLPDWEFPNDTISELPYIRVNRARGFTRELSVTHRLNEIMHHGFSVVEIGKLSLDGSSELKKRAMDTIELGWLRRAHEEDVYIAHVTSAAHARLYRKYGFEVAETFEVNGNKEAILWVRGYNFMRALEDLHHVQRQNSIAMTQWPIQPLLPGEGVHQKINTLHNKRPFE